MATKSDKFPDVIKIDTKTFAGLWAEWNKTNPPEEVLRAGYKVPENWEQIHNEWKRFVLYIFDGIKDYEVLNTDDTVKVSNKWMNSHKELDTDAKKFNELSGRCFTKIRGIQKKLAEKNPDKWQLKKNVTKTGRTQIDWNKSNLVPAPYGMECKKPEPPKQKKSSSSTWEDIESFFTPSEDAE